MKSIICMLLLILNSGLWASPRSFLSIKPVLIEDIAGITNAAYWKPCGYEEQGLIVQDSRNTRKIGVLLKSNGSECLNPATKEKINLSEVFSEEFLSKAISMNPRRESFRLRRLHVENSYLFKGTLSSNYRTRCLNGIAQIIRPNQSGIEVGVLGIHRKEACSVTSKKISMQGIKKDFHGSVKVMRGDEKRSYQIKMAPIKSDSIVMERDGTKSFSYLRQCYDAPIGIIKRKGRFAMLVARYSQMACPKDGPKRVWSKYYTRQFLHKLDSNTLMKVSNKDLSFELRSPQSISYEDRRLKIQSSPGCGKFAGIVLREELRKEFVSTIHLASDNPCKKPPRRVSLKLAKYSSVGSKPKSLRLLY